MTILPPFQPAAQQALAMFTLTSFQYGQLGHYPRLTDPQVQAAITRFQGELSEIEVELVDRDRTARAFCPYPYLRPSRVPNSTNI
jgi:arachidonate 15-lipoxygenase